MHIRPYHLLILLLTLAACNSSSGSPTTPPQNNATANNAFNNTPRDTQGRCAERNVGDDLTPALEPDPLDCTSTEPDNPCARFGTQTRTRLICFSDLASTGEPCGPLGERCTPRTLVDELPCALNPTQLPLSEGPPSACVHDDDETNPCATSGVSTRTLRVCQDGTPTNIQERTPCTLDTEGLLIDAGDLSAPCNFPQDNRCAQEGTRERLTQRCQDGEVVSDVELITCARNTDGDTRELELTPCLPVDACGAEGAQERAFALCLDGEDNLLQESRTCTLPHADVDLQPQGSSTRPLEDFAVIGAEEDPRDLLLGPTFTPPSILLCRLQTVYGDLTLNTTEAVQSIRLDALNTVYGDLTIEAQGEIDLPALAEVRGDLTLRGIDLQKLRLPALLQITGALRVEDTRGQLLNLPRLGSVGALHFQNNDFNRFTLNQLNRVQGDLDLLNNPALQIFELLALARIDGSLHIEGSPSLRTCDLYAYVSVINTRQGIGGQIDIPHTTDARFNDTLPTSDQDGDSLVEACDNCPGTHNPDQLDANQNGVGDACE